MKLRYLVDMQNCFRQGIDCSSEIQVVDVDPGKLSPSVRSNIADRLAPGMHLGEEVMDVCWLNASEASVEDDTLYIPQAESNGDPGATGYLVTAKLPGLEHLVEAVQEEENEIAEYFARNGIKFAKREIL